MFETYSKQDRTIYRGVLARAWAAFRTAYPNLTLGPVALLADPAAWTSEEDRHLLLETSVTSSGVVSFTGRIEVTFSGGQWVLGEVETIDELDFRSAQAQEVADCVMSHPLLLAKSLDAGARDRIATAIMEALPEPEPEEGGDK